MKIDDTDKSILNTILKNSRMSCREIAKKAGVSVVTVLKRMKALEKRRIIKSYTAELDYEKIGYDIEVIILMRIAKGRLFEVEKKIASNQNVHAIYDVTGKYDAMIIGRFRNRKSMDVFLKNIQTFGFVERTETILVLNVIKEENIGVS